MSQSSDPAPPYPPRVLTKAHAAAYCSLTEKGFDEWVKTGKLPRAMKGTRRWDKVALDQAIDLISGVSRDKAQPRPGLTSWMDGYRARKAAEAAREAEIDRKSLNPIRQRRHRERVAKEAEKAGPKEQR